MINQSPSVLHSIDTTGPGGAETVFLDLAQHLTIDGFESLAIIKGPGWVEDQLKQRGINYYIVKPHGFLSLAYYWDIARILKRHNVKLIQAHLLGSTLTYSILSLILRIPLIATLHGRVDVNPNEKWVYLKNKIMHAGVNRLVTVSQDLANYIVERRLFHKRDICVIYNGVVLEKYRGTDSTEVRDQLELTNDAILIGSVGNVRPAKAYSVLIDAARIIRPRHPNVHFVIAGHQKPTLMAKLDAQLDELRVRDRVHFLGFHPNTAAFLGQMNLFALSSSSEGFSIATIEAMATGLPVVATRCGGPEEILDHNETGWLVPTNDPTALAEGLMTLLDDSKLRGRLAYAGRNKVEKTFSMERLLDKYRGEYAALLNATVLAQDTPCARHLQGEPLNSEQR